tara:strand:+ start:1948 stop:2868 length:921 start_codon:yes stop_codon:yes gene_type:complete
MNISKININSTDDLTKYCNNELKQRTKILVKNNDKFIKYLIAIIIKYDDDLNIHVRYLDNPLSNSLSNSFWWYDGNEPGIDPNIYNIDNYSFLTSSDFSDNGYDDIICLKQNHIYHIPDFYPYYNGKYGNIYINDYFEELYNSNIKYILPKYNDIPDTILDSIGPGYLRYNLKSISDIIDVNGLNESYIMKLISYKLNHFIIRKISDTTNISYQLLENIKKSFKKCEKYNTDFINYLLIFSNIFKIKYIIYTFKDYNCTVKIIGKEYKTSFFLYKVNDIYYIIKNAEHSNEDSENSKDGESCISRY